MRGLARPRCVATGSSLPSAVGADVLPPPPSAAAAAARSNVILQSNHLHSAHSAFRGPYQAHGSPPLPRSVPRRDFHSDDHPNESLPGHAPSVSGRCFRKRVPGPPGGPGTSVLRVTGRPWRPAPSNRLRRRLPPDQQKDWRSPGSASPPGRPLDALFEGSSLRGRSPRALREAASAGSSPSNTASSRPFFLLVRRLPALLERVRINKESGPRRPAAASASWRTQAGR